MSGIYKVMENVSNCKILLLCMHVTFFGQFCHEKCKFVDNCSELLHVCRVEQRMVETVYINLPGLAIT